MISRAGGTKKGKIINSVLAEHGYAALIRTTTADETTRTMLFDFGFSKGGAAFNARALGVDMGEVEVLALSHGHSDHTGGLRRLARMVGKRVGLVVHPAVFKSPRYLKLSDGSIIHFPKFTRKMARQAGVRVVEAKKPYRLLEGDVLFLGEIERCTDFEKGFPIAYFQENGVEKWDPIEDDTAVVMNVKGKGLVILSGCAHSGIINTVNYAWAVINIDKVYAVMGGFHLSGPLFEPIIGRTTEELKKINPAHIIPTHCTGRKAIMHMEREMPSRFILNMSGTKLTFTAANSCCGSGIDIKPYVPQFDQREKVKVGRLEGKRI